MDKKQQFFNEFFSEIIRLIKKEKDLALPIAYLLTGSVKYDVQNNDFYINWDIILPQKSMQLYASLLKKDNDWELLANGNLHRLNISCNYTFEDVKPILINDAQDTLYLMERDNLTFLDFWNKKFEYVQNDAKWKFEISLLWSLWRNVQENPSTTTSNTVCKIIENILVGQSFNTEITSNKTYTILYKAQNKYSSDIELVFDLNNQKIDYKTNYGSGLLVQSFHPIPLNTFSFNEQDLNRFFKKEATNNYEQRHQFASRFAK